MSGIQSIIMIGLHWWTCSVKSIILTWWPWGEADSWQLITTSDPKAVQNRHKHCCVTCIGFYELTLEWRYTMLVWNPVMDFICSKLIVRYWADRYTLKAIQSILAWHYVRPTSVSLCVCPVTGPSWDKNINRTAKSQTSPKAWRVVRVNST